MIFPQLRLLHLSHGVAREIGHEQHPLGLFKAGEVGGKRLQDGGLGKIGAAGADGDETLGNRLMAAGNAARTRATPLASPILRRV